MVRFAYLIVGFTLAFSATSAKLVDNLETSLSVLGVATEGLYTGQTTAKGLPHGEGTFSVTAGEHEGGRLVGDFSSGCITGYLTAYSKKGAKIAEGDWVDGVPHGKGSSFYENGNVEYSGDLVKGVSHGVGRHYDEAGALRYEGEWREGEQQYLKSYTASDATQNINQEMTFHTHPDTH